MREKQRGAMNPREPEDVLLQPGYRNHNKKHDTPFPTPNDHDLLSS